MEDFLHQGMNAAIAAGQNALPIDIPIGSALFLDRDTLLGVSHNRVSVDEDATAHAELCLLKSVTPTYLQEFGHRLTLFVTMEPCPMCAWAIRMSNIRQVVFGAHSPLYGAAGSRYDLLRDGRLVHPAVDVVGGVREEECSSLISSFFRQVR